MLKLTNKEIEKKNNFPCFQLFLICISVDIGSTYCSIQGVSKDEMKLSNYQGLQLRNKNREIPRGTIMSEGEKTKPIVSLCQMALSAQFILLHWKIKYRIRTRILQVTLTDASKPEAVKNENSFGNCIMEVVFNYNAPQSLNSPLYFCTWFGVQSHLWWTRPRWCVFFSVILSRRKKR